MKLIASMLLVALVCGCTERDRQRNVLTGGDPALATQHDLQELKKDVADLNKVINDRFDRLEKSAESAESAEKR